MFAKGRLRQSESAGGRALRSIGAVSIPRSPAVPRIPDLASATPPTVAIAQVRSVLLGAQHRGLDTAALLQRAGIAPALLASPLARVSQAQFARLLRTLRRALRDELWGLTDRPLPPGSFARCAAQLLRCATLEQALREGFAYYHLLLDEVVPRLVVAQGVAQVRIVPRAEVPAPDARREFGRRTLLFYTFGLASWLVARRVPLLQVDYTSATASGESSRIYQTPIRAGQPHLGFSFESRWLALPVVQSPQSLHEFLAQAPGNLLTRYRDGASTSERIRRLLRPHLGEELPALEDVARALGSTAPTLRRRLADEGRGYQALKDELRRDAAIACLTEPGLTLIDVANRVGFSEASTFCRAFKKWTGVAPGEYRQRRLPGAPPP